MKTFKKWIGEKMDEAKKPVPGAPPIPRTPGYKPGPVGNMPKKQTPEAIAKRKEQSKKDWQGFGAIK